MPSEMLQKQLVESIARFRTKTKRLRYESKEASLEVKGGGREVQMPFLGHEKSEDDSEKDGTEEDEAEAFGFDGGPS